MRDTKSPVRFPPGLPAQFFQTSLSLNPGYRYCSASLASALTAQIGLGSVRFVTLKE
jgi:hypothetical protein